MFLHCPCCFARVLFFLWRQNGQTDSLPEESRPCSLQHQPILWSVTWRGNGTNRTPKMVVDRETRNDVSTSKKRWHEIIETASFQLSDPWMDHPNGGSLRNNTPKNRGHPGRTWMWLEVCWGVELAYTPWDSHNPLKMAFQEERSFLCTMFQGLC